MTAGLDTAHRRPRLVVVVHPDRPLVLDTLTSAGEVRVVLGTTRA